MVASSATSEHVLDILTHVNLSQGIIPDEWKNERRILLEALMSTTVAPQGLECILLLSSNLFLSVSLYPSTLKSFDLRL
jgi:hypothetical protein